MKLQEICDNLHFNALKALGLLFNVGIGEIYEVTSSDDNTRFLTETLQIFKEEGVSNFMKLEKY